jgi:hypothetical protein
MEGCPFITQFTNKFAQLAIDEDNDENENESQTYIKLHTDVQTSNKSYQSKSKYRSRNNEKKKFYCSPKSDTSVKRILCENMIKYGTCKYKNACKYAHNLSEQKVDEHRVKAISIIVDDKKDLSDVNLIENYHLYNTLIIYTKLCDNCANKTCFGGLNCIHGAVLQKMVICAEDLVYGKCMNSTCQHNHLTKRGLIPYTEQKKRYLNDHREDIKSNDIIDNKTSIETSVDDTQSIHGLRQIKNLDNALIKEIIGNQTRNYVDMNVQLRNAKKYYGFTDEDIW